jgi:hypothetical protein
VALFQARAARFATCTGGPAGAALPWSPNAINYLCGLVDTWSTSGQLTADPSQATQCIKDIGAVSCGLSSDDLVETLFSPPSCAGVIQGLVPNGGACHDDLQCAPGTYCDDVGCSAPGTGTCRPVPGAGELCGCRPGHPGGITVCGECATGLACDFDNGDVCVVPKALNATCDGSVRCAPGLHCEAGTCQALAHAASCTAAASGGPSNDCLASDLCLSGSGGTTSCTATSGAGKPCSGSGPCAPGSFCDGSMCATLPSAAGSPCGLVNGQQVACLDAYCAAPVLAGVFDAAGTCLALAAAGDSCALPLNAEGVPNSSCTAGATCSQICSYESCY